MALPTTAHPASDWCCVRTQGRFDLIRRHPKLHRLGITNILLVPEQNLLCTLAYDCTLRVSEASTG